MTGIGWEVRTLSISSSARVEYELESYPTVIRALTKSQRMNWQDTRIVMICSACDRPALAKLATQESIPLPRPAR